MKNDGHVIFAVVFFERIKIKMLQACCKIRKQIAIGRDLLGKITHTYKNITY